MLVQKTTYTWRHWSERLKEDVACHVAGKIPTYCSANKFVVLSALNILSDYFSNLTALTGQDSSGTSVHNLSTISPVGIKAKKRNSFAISHCQAGAQPMPTFPCILSPDNREDSTTSTPFHP